VAGGAAEQRKEERVRAALRVQLADDIVGLTRDVSASGLFFETSPRYAARSPINFTIEIPGPAYKMLLRCRADILRIERQESRLGIAVKFLDTRLTAQPVYQ
jgi:hypothetical protein